MPSGPYLLGSTGVQPGSTPEDRHAAVAAEEPVLLGVRDSVGSDASAESRVEYGLADERRDLILVVEGIELALAFLASVTIAHCVCARYNTVTMNPTRALNTNDYVCSSPYWRLHFLCYLTRFPRGVAAVRREGGLVELGSPFWEVRLSRYLTRFC